jgi:hypothetical protein
MNRRFLHFVKGDSPIFADHGCAAVPAKIGTVPKKSCDESPHAIENLVK